MLIDWFTVGAQALNFLILVWLMKRFLYKPILHAIDAREQRIADELADADAKKAEAKQERDEFQQKNDEFDQERTGLVSKAKEEALAESQRLMKEARVAADSLSKKRDKALREEAEHLDKEITRRTQDEVFSITRKVLTDLASTSLEEQVSDVFVRRLREMDDQSKSDLGNALKEGSDPALVRSSFDLPHTQQAAIQEAINETFSTKNDLRFESDPDLISGIELTVNGQKVGWSAADYLKSMEKSVGELLRKKVRTEPEAAAEPEAKIETKEAEQPDSETPPPKESEPDDDYKMEEMIHE
jgi:F-type H+-transporting ATPase subunit b